MRFEHTVNRWSRRLLGFFVRDLPLELKPWGEAMLAEMPQVRGVFAPVSWAIGGSIVLSKSLIRRWFSGKAESSTVASSGTAGANSPAPLPRLALAMLLLCFAMLLLPSFRQGLRTSLESWNPLWTPHGQLEFERLLDQSEKLGDPESLAFVALNTNDPGKAFRLAKSAVERNPQLEWIWYSLIQGQFYFVKPAIDLHSPEVVATIQRLQQADPENSVPYLLEAERIRWSELDSPHPFSSIQQPTTAEERQLWQAWRATMERAYAAPRCDSYFNRRMQLERSVLLKLKQERPLAFLNQMYWLAIPQWSNNKQYSDLLLQEGDNALRAGDPNKAAESYWQVARFAERMRAQASSTYERWFAAGFQRESYQKLSALMAQTRQDQEKARIDQTLAALQQEHAKLDDPRGFWVMIYYGPVSTVGIVVSVAAAVAVLALALTILGMGYFLTRQWLRFPALPLLDSLLTKAARFSPFALAASCVVLYFTYLPYASLYASYMNGTLRPEEGEKLRAFMEIRYLPDRVITLLGGVEGLRICFWAAITAVLTLVVIAFLWRWAPRKARPVSTS
ncbi:MAG TPA: hypothetical protein VF532_13845 [Candidatus Angelobacter sp.]